MKLWIVKIEIIGLGGRKERDLEIKARTQKSAEKKAYAIIGDRTGNILSTTKKELH